ncbi:hypothetical protein BH10PSE7_BH10PSE7_36730 [soil metagenome]
MPVFNLTDASDDKHGSGGKDTINGLGGQDRLFGDAGNDSISGGDDNDNLFGQDGNDILNGGDGDDYSEGEAGDDTINGGEGDDGVGYYSAGDGVNVNLKTGTVSDGQGGTDKLSGIEEIYASSFADVIISDNAGPDSYRYFDAGAGDDTITGGTGYDIAGYFDNFTDANSPLRIGIVADLVKGTVRDGFGDTDHIKNIEEIEGTRFSDVFIGNGQDNVFRPFFGSDLINGGAGEDRVNYAGDFHVAVRSGIAVRSVGINADLDLGRVIDLEGRIDKVTNIEDVTGSRLGDEIRGNAVANVLEGIQGDDFLAGRGGSDELIGANGNDHILGGVGNDTIAGGAGDNALHGGAGADRFVIELSDDYDTIRDFKNGADKIDVRAFDFASGGAVKALAEQHGSSVVIELNNDTTIELQNTTLSQILAGDFLV